MYFYTCHLEHNIASAPTWDYPTSSSMKTMYSIMEISRRNVSNVEHCWGVPGIVVTLTPLTELQWHDYTWKDAVNFLLPTLNNEGNEDGKWDSENTITNNCWWLGAGQFLSPRLDVPAHSCMPHATHYCYTLLHTTLLYSLNCVFMWLLCVDIYSDPETCQLCYCVNV